jgi:endonuclease YncB( thermonuclease family)
MLIAPEEPGVETLRVPVLKVFDGDGFLTRIYHPRRGSSIEVTIRFGFIDAPEMDQRGGPEAQAFLQSLIGDKFVDLAILTKMDTGGIVDRHGRIVAIPYLPVECQTTPLPGKPWGSDSSRNIELEMVLNGWAWVLDRYGPDDRYCEALEDAQRYRRGIWGFDGNVHPWEHKKRRYRMAQSQKLAAIQPSLFSETADAAACPKGCGGTLVVREGRFGPFMGCSNFPQCRHSSNI